jgi:hypothetical protein
MRYWALAGLLLTGCSGAEALKSADTTALYSRFDAAQTALIDCVLGHADDLAFEPEKPENLAAAAFLSCPKEAEELADAAFLNLGDAASREFMQRAEERVRNGAVAIVVLARTKRPAPPAAPVTKTKATLDL